MTENQKKNLNDLTSLLVLEKKYRLGIDGGRRVSDDDIEEALLSVVSEMLGHECVVDSEDVAFAKLLCVTGIRPSCKIRRANSKKVLACLNAICDRIENGRSYKVIFDIAG